MGDWATSPAPTPASVADVTPSARYWRLARSMAAVIRASDVG